MASATLVSDAVVAAAVAFCVGDAGDEVNSREVV